MWGKYLWAIQCILCLQRLLQIEGRVVTLWQQHEMKNRSYLGGPCMRVKWFKNIMKECDCSVVILVRSYNLLTMFTSTALYTSPWCGTFVTSWKPSAFTRRKENTDCGSLDHIYIICQKYLPNLMWHGCILTHFIAFRPFIKHILRLTNTYEYTSKTMIKWMERVGRLEKKGNGKNRTIN